MSGKGSNYNEDEWLEHGFLYVDVSYVSFKILYFFFKRLMISFVSDNFLKEEPCCKSLLKYNINNYFRQFTKTLTICFK